MLMQIQALEFQKFCESQEPKKESQEPGRKVLTHLVFLTIISTYHTSGLVLMKMGTDPCQVKAGASFRNCGLSSYLPT